jgi:hypothetical protein
VAEPDPAGNNRTAAARPSSRRHRKQSRNTEPACGKVGQADLRPLPVTEATSPYGGVVHSCMGQTKTSHETLAAARMRRMRQRQGRGAFLVTLELEPDDLAALRVPSPDLAGQAIFRLIDRLKDAR